jgi:alkylhydroperoxidase/carboxymuconolactone decarboxylase family protein YurZ
VDTDETTLRKLTIADEGCIESVLASEASRPAKSPLDNKTHALVKVAALIAIDAPSASYIDAIDAARTAGASDDELVACLLAVLPTLGAPRVVSAAPKLGLALGYDVVAALEEPTGVSSA